MRFEKLPSSSAIALALWLAAASARAQYGDADENDYDEAGVVEIGGSIGTSWNENLFTLDFSPQIGWFLATGFELSLIVRGEYVNEEEDDGTRTSTKSGSALIEPSYHFPIQDESLFAFGGLGVGGGYDGEHPDFELVPRVGLNIELGRAAVLTPAVRVPVMFGKNQGRPTTRPAFWSASPSRSASPRCCEGQRQPAPRPIKRRKELAHGRAAEARMLVPAVVRVRAPDHRVPRI